jgi:hypothetical protein
MTMGARHFLSAAASLLLMTATAEASDQRAANAAAGELSARAPADFAASAGRAETGVRTLQAQGALLYVPWGYRPGRAAPLLVMLHGAGGSAARSIALTREHAERLGFLVLAPKSRGPSWDVISSRRFGPDVSGLDSALAETFAAYSVDPARVAIVGQRVLEQLPDDLGRRGHHVGADLRRFDDVHRMADAGDQDLRREIVIVVDQADVGDQRHAVEADVVVAADEGRDEGRAGLGREQRLGGREAQVTLTIVPSPVSALHALSPAGVSGTLIAILSAIFRSTSASRIIPS